MKRKKFKKLWKRMGKQVFRVRIDPDRTLYYDRGDNLIGVSFSDGKRAIVRGNLK